MLGRKNCCGKITCNSNLDSITHNGPLSMADQKELVVTCSVAEGSVQRVEQRLREIGFQIDQVLNFAGSITGRCDKPLETLREIPEVDAVEESEMNFPQ